MCGPFATVLENGEEQTENGSVSIAHSKVDASVEVKVKPAAVELVNGGGLSVIVVFGAVRSIVHAKVAGVGSTLPSWSIARTSNV